MGVEPVPRLIVTMSVPIMLSMMVQALYNIVDSIFVARLSENALSAVSLAFPVQNFMIAVGTGTGVGVSALLSRSLGEKNFDRADRTAGNALFLAVASSLIFLLFGLFLTELYYASLTDIEDIARAGIAYTRVVTTASIGLMGALMTERLLMATGRTVFSMITQMSGAVTNMILDPILIFGLFGAPAMGVTGAAVATVAGQFLSLALGLVFNLRKNPDIRLSVKNLRPDGGIIARIYRVGVPSIVMASIGSVMTFFMNKILLSFTETATAVFGAYFKLQSFVFMPVFGMNNGIVPIVAYNYGARSRERIREAMKYGMLYAEGIMLFGTLVFQLLPRPLLLLFSASERMMQIGVPALRIISLCFMLAGFNIVTVSVSQALGRSLFGLWLSVIRQIAVLLPAAYLFSLLGNVDLVWISFPLAEAVALVISLAYRRKIERIIDF
ncbi:MAG: MATE family efflux transporter [Lachnospiraceae bacterium]|nr:MATE family efflux transporter [Lachnospiraceae bacterium]